MPHTKPRRWAFTLGVLATLAVVTVTLSVFLLILYGQVDKAERKVAALEAASTTAEVATCYASARGRPRLITILRGLAVKLDPDPRDATLELVDEFERSTPTVPQCDRLAVRRGLRPEDFPPPEVP